MEEVSFEASEYRLLAKVGNVLLVGKRKPFSKSAYEELSVWNLGTSYAVVLEVGFDYGSGEALLKTFDAVAPNGKIACFSTSLYDKWYVTIPEDQLKDFIHARNGENGQNSVSVSVTVLSEGHVRSLKWEMVMKPLNPQGWEFQGDPLPLKEP